MKFSFDEQVDMILVYGEMQRNSIRAAALYAERYPNRRHPSHRTFQRLCNKLKETGNLGTRKSSRHKTVTNERNAIGVLAIVAHNPQISSRRIERESAISRTSILRILARYKFHPYHISLHQELHGTDFMNRVTFCQWALQKIQTNETFISSILFTDEATFTNHGNLNLHNMHYWSSNNPHWLRQVEHQRQWSVNVWCGILNDQIIGPHFINGNLTGERYEHFLQNTLGILLENVPLNVRQTMWLQHDGCPAHYARRVRDVLNDLYPNRWIGRGGLVPWPARSPDLTPLDFFLWGALKHVVYEEVPTTPENMKQRIIAACAGISSDTIRQAHDAAKRRLQLCIDVDGHHFEHLL